MKIIKNIVYSNTPPKNTNDIWLKPISIATGEFELFFYTKTLNTDNTGWIKKWVPLCNKYTPDSPPTNYVTWYYGAMEESKQSFKDIYEEVIKNGAYSNTSFLKSRVFPGLCQYIIIPSIYQLEEVFLSGHEYFNYTRIGSYKNEDNIDYDIYSCTLDNDMGGSGQIAIIKQKEESNE